MARMQPAHNNLTGPMHAPNADHSSSECCSSLREKPPTNAKVDSHKKCRQNARQRTCTALPWNYRRPQVHPRTQPAPWCFQWVPVGAYRTACALSTSHASAAASAANLLLSPTPYSHDPKWRPHPTGCACAPPFSPKRQPFFLVTRPCRPVPSTSVLLAQHPSGGITPLAAHLTVCFSTPGQLLTRSPSGP